MSRFLTWIKNINIETKISYGFLILSLTISSLIISFRNKNNNQNLISQIYIIPTNTKTVITPTQIVVSSNPKKNEEINLSSSKISAKIITPIISLTPTLQSTPTPTTIPTPTPTTILTPTPTPIIISTPTPVLYPEKIKLSSSRLVLYKNQMKRLSIEYEPEHIVNKKVTWSVDNGDILSVNGDGLITALNTGMATIKVTSENKLTDEATILILSSQEQINKYLKINN